jgi:hypothetical protein
MTVVVSIGFDILLKFVTYLLEHCPSLQLVQRTTAVP